MTHSLPDEHLASHVGPPALTLHLRLSSTHPHLPGNSSTHTLPGEHSVLHAGAIAVPHTELSGAHPHISVKLLTMHTCSGGHVPSHVGAEATPHVTPTQTPSMQVGSSGGQSAFVMHLHTPRVGSASSGTQMGCSGVQSASVSHGLLLQLNKKPREDRIKTAVKQPRTLI